ncbi:hypothetical protein GGI15_003337 [Coemansia interrupta]|uniref:F-box domain-containing protein n=1 Tax=Coemansia interrupta TaxID=1126814 RepID=A0A9W8LI69_9FUNG|nr:hypothetical protein GGI15_003337 [Coemansia interrupta]
MSDPVVVLPADISILIFRHMELYEIAHCMLVSRTWYYSLDKWAVLWSDVDMGGGSGKTKTSIRERLEAGLDHIVSGSRQSQEAHQSRGGAQNVKLLYDENLKTLARRAGAAMWRLALRYSPLISDAGISSLLHFGCVNIRHLEIRANKRISNSMLEALVRATGGRLEFVGLGTTEVSDHVVQQLLVSAPNLVFLDLSFCRYITSDAFPVAESSCFVFSSTKDPEADLATLGDSDDAASSSEQSQDSTNTHVNCHPTFSIDGGSLPKLRVLLLDGCSGIRNTVVRRILTAFEDSICTLSMSRTSLTLQAIQLIGTFHKKPLTLTCLMMNEILTRIGDDEAARALTNNWFGLAAGVIKSFTLAVPHITQLALGGGNNLVTDSLIIGVSQTCRGLLRIDVHDSLRLGDRCLIALGENCNDLKHVNIGGCIGCSDEGVIAMVHGCRVIEELDISTLNITDNSLIAVGANLLHLQRFFVDFCRQITDDGIKAVLEGSNGLGCMFTLKHLSFVQCRKVNDAIVDWCRARLRPEALVVCDFSARQ